MGKSGHGFQCQLPGGTGCRLEHKLIDLHDHPTLYIVIYLYIIVYLDMCIYIYIYICVCVCVLIEWANALVPPTPFQGWKKKYSQGIV